MTTRRIDGIGPSGMAVLTKVRLLRKKRGLSLRQMAEETRKIRPTLAADTLNKIELGMRRIDVDDLFALATALGVTPAQLLELPEQCSTCHGKPPTGFACLACGTTQEQP